MYMYNVHQCTCSHTLYGAKPILNFCTNVTNTHMERNEKEASEYLIERLHYITGSNKNHHQVAGMSSRYSSKPSTSGSSTQNNHHQQNAPKLPQSASISISAFPSADVLGHNTGSNAYGYFIYD